jgi:hypothetical protein
MASLGLGSGAPDNVARTFDDMGWRLKLKGLSGLASKDRNCWAIEVRLSEPKNFRPAGAESAGLFAEPRKRDELGVVPKGLKATSKIALCAVRARKLGRPARS